MAEDPDDVLVRGYFGLVMPEDMPFKEADFLTIDDDYMYNPYTKIGTW